MKFQKGSRRKAIEYEKDLVIYWKQNQTFEKSVSMRPKGNAYVFYDGPPFITGVPHHGTLLSSIVKDAIPRYWTMKGKRVERVWGWDCHGLPAEIFTEKKLGIVDKRDIGTKVSLEDYINTCRANMVQTGSEWEDTIDRIGRWVDFKGAYKTMDKDYMESVWWAFKKLYDDGKIYEGEKVLLYCTRDATPISKAEVAMDNSYQDVTDPSVYVKLKLTDADNTYLLAWTTTPWTLPANTGAAVNPKLEYSEVELGDEVFIVAKDLVEKVFTDEKHNLLPHKVLRTFSGQELVGKNYEPLFEDRGANAHKVWAADYVTLDDGTGIVHIAPAYGEEDYFLAKEKKFPIVSNVDENGHYTDGEWQGKQIWEINKEIAKTLHERGVVWKIDYIRHSYPHCHRCGTRLMYRAHPSWFMNIGDQRQTMLEQNADINWFPEHIKQGRFAKTVETAPDWNLSRDRFWATAMPVWKGIDKHGKELIKVVGSYQELKDLSGVELEDYHRPWVDNIKFNIDGVEYTRIDRVLDSWFEAGSMPFAQFHYPFENVEKFEANFPGDFIAEYVGQVRAWFYYLHSLSVGLFGTSAFKNVIVTGTLAGNDGRKMSKSYGNYTDPNELMDLYGADALRLLLLSSPVLNGEDVTLQDKEVADVSRKLSMVWNMYDFFTLYADVDSWDSGLKAGELPADPSAELNNPLDQWIISRVHQLSQEVDKQVQAYDLPNALKPILPFIDDASNWYVRRSRKRFWNPWTMHHDDQSSGQAARSDVVAGTGDDFSSAPLGHGSKSTVSSAAHRENHSSTQLQGQGGLHDDKDAAYRTLHYVLVQLSLIMAPFTPFLSEELYRKLTGGESVHLRDWPEVGHINETVVNIMADVRLGIEQGLAQRALARLKVRQPLASAKLYLTSMPVESEIDYYKQIVSEELNVKNVEFVTQLEASNSTELDLELTSELRAEGTMREIVRNVQQARKEAGLEVDDRINLWLTSDNEKLVAVLKNSQLTDVIVQETLTKQLNQNQPEGFTTTVKVDAAELTITLSKS